MVNANSTSQLHQATVLDDVTETEFVGVTDVKKEEEEGEEEVRFAGDGRPYANGRPFPDGRSGRPSPNGRCGGVSPDGRPSPDGRDKRPFPDGGSGGVSPYGRNGRPSFDGRIQEGRSRLAGGRREEGMREMVVD